MFDRSPTGRKVYITNLGYHDYSPAKRYGDFVVLTKGRVDLYHTDRLAAEINEKLKDAEEQDYLLVSGAPIIVALCTAQLFSRFGVVNFLYWDPLFSDYILRPYNGQHPWEYEDEDHV